MTAGNDESFSTTNVWRKPLFFSDPVRGHPYVAYLRDHGTPKNIYGSDHSPYYGVENNGKNTYINLNPGSYYVSDHTFGQSYKAIVDIKLDDAFVAGTFAAIRFNVDNDSAATLIGSKEIGLNIAFDVADDSKDTISIGVDGGYYVIDLPDDAFATWKTITILDNNKGIMKIYYEDNFIATVELSNTSGGEYKSVIVKDATGTEKVKKTDASVSSDYNNMNFGVAQNADKTETPEGGLHFDNWGIVPYEFDATMNDPLAGEPSADPTDEPADPTEKPSQPTDQPTEEPAEDNKVLYVSYDEIRPGILCGGNEENIKNPVLETGTSEATFWGWVALTQNVKSFSYSINRGEKVDQPFAVVEAEQAVLDAVQSVEGATTASRFSVVVPVTEGTQIIEICAEFEDGSSEVFWTAELTVGKQTDSDVSVPDDFKYMIKDSQVEITGYKGTATKVVIPSEIEGYPVISIGVKAFYACKSLTSITIPESVTNIGNFAFASCLSLTKIEVSEKNQNYTSVDGVLFNKSKTKIICCPAGKNGDYIIPDSVTSIGAYAFEWCYLLTSITIPKSVTSIGDSAFAECTSITSITIPGGVKSIGTYMFELCTSLTRITINEGVTSIGASAFEFCTFLKSITIPKSVTNIDASAFYSCGALTDVYYTGTEEDWSNITIDDADNELLFNAVIHFLKQEIIAPTVDSNLVVDTETSLVSGITAESKPADVIAQFKGSDNIQIVGKDGKLLADDAFVGTGCKVQLIENGEVKDEVTVVIKGEIDGNGKIDSDDAIYLLRNTLFASLYPVVVDDDVDGNGEYNSDDAIHLLRHTLFPSLYPLK